MSTYRTSQAVSGLKAVLDRVNGFEKRFQDNPLRAVGIFPEGVLNWDRSHLNDPPPVARFLVVPVEQIARVQGTVYENRDTTHEGPYFVYLPTGATGGNGSSETELRRQLDALGPVLEQLLDSIDRLPSDFASRFRRDEKRNWWSVLFQLATHHHGPLLSASRERWLNITSAARRDDRPPTWSLKYPYERPKSELDLQLHTQQKLSEDVVPGTIWSRLKDDVFSSTAQAIEMIITDVESATVEAAPPDWAAIRFQFAELHRHFAHLAEQECHWQTSNWRFVKLANSFRMRAAEEWCGFPMELRFRHLRLSQRHADCECLLYRTMSDDVRSLFERAGDTLPPTIADGPVMFSRPIGEFVVGSGAHLDPDPVAKWVRFVFNSLRENDPSGDEVCFNYESAVDRVLNPFEDIYGYATLKNGFFAASAKAIELAGLLPLPVTPLSGPSSQASEIGDVESPLVTANPSTPEPTKPPKRSTERGEGETKLIAALTKHHKYADGSCLRPEPIGNNELAKEAGVSISTASKFFARRFDGYSKYRVLCRNGGYLADSLKVLNNEFSPHDLYGRRPPNEDDRDENND